MTDRVTMSDVAKRAGVHVTTVSLALRNHPKLPVATRKRIQELAKKMGFKQDPALSALVAYRQRTAPHKNKLVLAYVTHWDTRFGWKDFPAHREFFEGASERASLLGYHLEHFWLGEPGLTVRRFSGILRARGITGLIIATHRGGAKEPLDLDWSQFSAVKIDFLPHKPELHMVTNDQCAIIRQAVQHVIAAGYRRIGLVMPRWWDEFVDLAWSAGFLSEQQRLRPEERIPILFYSTNVMPEYPSPDAQEQIAQRTALAVWLQTYRPDVVVSRTSFVWSHLEQLGISVPADLAFADIFLENTEGVTAGVRQNCHRVGEMAIELVVGQLHQNIYGIPAIPIMTLVEGTWFDGESLPLRRGHAETGTAVPPDGKLPC